MKLRLDKFNEGICIRTGVRYRWLADESRWVKKAFQQLDDLTRKRLANRGIDPELSYEAFQAEIRIQPPAGLLHHLAEAPVIPLHELSGNLSNPKFWGWKTPMTGTTRQGDARHDRR